MMLCSSAMNCSSKWRPFFKRCSVCYLLLWWGRSTTAQQSSVSKRQPLPSISSYLEVICAQWKQLYCHTRLRWQKDLTFLNKWQRTTAGGMPLPVSLPLEAAEVQQLERVAVVSSHTDPCEFPNARLRFAPCLMHTPPLLAWFVIHFPLHRFIFAPCLMHTLLFWALFVHPSLLHCLRFIFAPCSDRLQLRLLRCCQYSGWPRLGKKFTYANVKRPYHSCSCVIGCHCCFQFILPSAVVDRIQLQETCTQSPFHVSRVSHYP